MILFEPEPCEPTPEEPTGGLLPLLAGMAIGAATCFVVMVLVW